MKNSFSIRSIGTVGDVGFTNIFFYNIAIGIVIYSPFLYTPNSVLCIIYFHFTFVFSKYYNSKEQKMKEKKAIIISICLLVSMQFLSAQTICIIL
jgi:hypothetical protein